MSTRQSTLIKKVFLLILLLIPVFCLADDYFFYDRTIDANDKYDVIHVHCVEPYTTTLTINGGDVNEINVYAHSVIKINEGNIDRINLYDNSRLLTNAGKIKNIEQNENSHVTINDGDCEDIYVDHSGTLIIKGGNIEGINFYNINIAENIFVYITGGDIGAISAQGGYCHLAGGNIERLGVGPQVYLHGQNFNISEFNNSYYLTGLWLTNYSLSINLGKYFESSHLQYLNLTNEPLVFCEQLPEGDLNQDCKVDLSDFVIIIRNWLESGIYDQQDF